MTHIETACYALIASAFVLGGILVFSLGAQSGNQAYGDLVIARDNFSLMTTRTSNEEEALFVLDNTSGRLYVYTLDVGRKRLELAGGEDLTRVFQGAQNSDGGSGGARRGGR